MAQDVRGQLKDIPALWDKFTLKAYYSDNGGKEEAGPESGDPAVSRFLIEHGERFEYPDGKRFAVCLTHDIDEIYPPIAHTLLSVACGVKGLDAAGVGHAIGWRLKGKRFSPYLNFRKIMALEEKYEARSSFYFLATDKDIKRYRYAVEDAGEYMGEIADRGWEVGLHGGYYSYDDPEAIDREKRAIEGALGRAICGYRNHYLRFKYPDTWKHLEKAGLKYDTTVGYNRGVGFKNGMCHPFRPYDPCAGRELDIVEIPLCVMDCAVFDGGRTPAGAWDITKRMIDAARQYNGVVTLLWHNDAFSSPYKAGWVKLYEKALEYACQQNAWITSGENIYRWWRGRKDI